MTEGTSATLVDAYVVLRLPDGSQFSLMLDGSLIPGTVPLARSFSPFSFSGALLGYTLGGTEPMGSYVWTAMLAQAGTSSVITSANDLGFAVTP
jgi:hypothetical protein